MRRLHATGLRERFVAGGVYERPDGLREHWSAHEVGAGAVFVRVDRDGRAAGEGSLLQEALRHPDGHFERIDQQLYDVDGRPAARLLCTRFADQAELALDESGCRREAQVDLGPEGVIVAPGILLAGLALARAVRLARPVPRLQLRAKATGFAWERVTGETRCAARGKVTVAGREIEARRCGWRDSGQDYWLDAQDVALRCEDEAQTYCLTQYARRDG